MSTENSESSFEVDLRSQPWRAVPPHWHREILGTARAVVDQPHLAPRQNPFVLFWKELLWPHPLAWASLIPIWLVIAGLYLASPPLDNITVAHGAPRDVPYPRPDVAVKTAIAEQQRLRAELLGQSVLEARRKDVWPAELKDSEEAVPRPRSSLKSKLYCA